MRPPVAGEEIRHKPTRRKSRQAKRYTALRLKRGKVKPTVTDIPPDMAKYNWQAIKEEYVQAPDDASRPSLEQLAAKYGCSASHLREKAGEGNWKAEAARFLETVQQKRLERKTELVAGDLACWDIECFGVAQDLLLQLNRLLLEGGEPPTARSLETLTRALERIHKIGRTALGEQEGIKLDIDFTRLNDEQLARIVSGEDPRNVLAN